MFDKGNQLKLDDRDNTIFEKNVIFDDQMIKWTSDFEVDESSYPVDDLAEENLFLVGIIAYLEAQGITIDINETSVLTQEISKRYKEKGIPFTRTIREWLKGTIPSPDQAHKSNCYDLCIALDFSLLDTAEFLLKHFQVMPFNYKNRIDAIYYYCIKEKRPYSVVQLLIEKSGSFEMQNHADEINTQYIGRAIDEIDNEDEFVSFLRGYCYSPEYQFTTAKKLVLQLVDDCKTLIGKKTLPDSKMLMEITGYNNQITGGRFSAETKKNGGTWGLAKTSFPEKFKRGFPDGTELSKIRNGKTVSDEAVRKVLIILYLFKFFATRDRELQQEITEEIIKECRNDFCSEMNEILATCGYIQLYARNMFDWHILYCLNSKYPVSVLKHLIETMLGELAEQ